ncbi:hypothetical protein J8273_0393 [Carpediemonas membranifera]|uniref:Uncharacterized protein n=1 Tax=Carpediemonas membranifera TaxID=201153 RepID=A0A8J6AVF3_9EUKA|nr:hypothetical protein J8273_0393 [Carpediemonas membranifera]|eukprot:KAG9395173.1 hypothetical protein J8273_0393 [Carpediemonas membranifera]
MPRKRKNTTQDSTGSTNSTAARSGPKSSQAKHNTTANSTNARVLKTLPSSGLELKRVPDTDEPVPFDTGSIFARFTEIVFETLESRLPELKAEVSRRVQAEFGQARLPTPVLADPPHPADEGLDGDESDTYSEESIVSEMSDWDMPAAVSLARRTGGPPQGPREPIVDSGSSSSSSSEESDAGDEYEDEQESTPESGEESEEQEAESAGQERRPDAPSPATVAAVKQEPAVELPPKPLFTNDGKVRIWPREQYKPWDLFDNLMASTQTRYGQYLGKFCIYTRRQAMDDPKLHHPTWTLGPAPETAPEEVEAVLRFVFGFPGDVGRTLVTKFVAEKFGENSQARRAVKRVLLRLQRYTWWHGWHTWGQFATFDDCPGSKVGCLSYEDFNKLMRLMNKHVSQTDKMGKKTPAAGRMVMCRAMTMLMVTNGFTPEQLSEMRWRDFKDPKEPGQAATIIVSRPGEGAKATIILSVYSADALRRWRKLSPYAQLHGSTIFVPFKSSVGQTQQEITPPKIHTLFRRIRILAEEQKAGISEHGLEWLHPAGFRMMYHCLVLADGGGKVPPASDLRSHRPVTRVGPIDKGKETMLQAELIDEYTMGTNFN